jgi:outer membrane protein OmpA-like peptidoglycan-associated protein
MKRTALLLIAFCMAMQLQAQEKGHFLTVKGGLGAAGLQYNLQGPVKSGDRFNKLGWNAEIGYQYFFHKNWGIATGIGISGYRTLGTYPDGYRIDNCFDLGIQTDDDPVGQNNGQYRLRAHLTDWHEMQKTCFVEIPLMLMYQHKFGEKKNSGFFIGAGAKLLLPFWSKFNVMDAKDGEDNRLWITGYYEDGHLLLGGEGDPQLPNHGFSGMHNPYEKLKWEGEAPVKMGVALSGEAGFLIGLGSRVDLVLSAYVDWGLTNMKTGSPTLKDAYKNAFKKTAAENCSDLLQAPDSYLPGANDATGRGIAYNGMLISNRTDRISSLAFGGKIGLRIKLGKSSSSSTLPPLSERKEAARDRKASDSLKRRVDELDQKVDRLLNQQSNGSAAEPATATFKGTVMDKTHNSPVSATVKALDKHSSLLGMQISDPNTGAFEIENIPKGKTALLEITSPDYIKEVRNDIEVPEKGSSVQIFNILMSRLEKGNSFVVEDIFFDSDESVLKPASFEAIDLIFRIMTENPTLKVEISGHTDNAGLYEHNLILSKNRAASVVKALTDKGISASRLTVAGYGPDRPVATNETPEGRTQNRRVEFKILDF